MIRTQKDYFIILCYDKSGYLLFVSHLFQIASLTLPPFPANILFAECMFSNKTWLPIGLPYLTGQPYNEVLIRMPASPAQSPDESFIPTFYSGNNPLKPHLNQLWVCRAPELLKVQQ
ncbi:MAG TPA: hypothetical protein VFX43_11070 [Chitinophagaceae bacterium]|nr:hypothetical protein [Chitinophagaceae bacterium]